VSHLPFAFAHKKLMPPPISGYTIRYYTVRKRYVRSKTIKQLACAVTRTHFVTYGILLTKHQQLLIVGIMTPFASTAHALHCLDSHTGTRQPRENRFQHILSDNSPSPSSVTLSLFYVLYVLVRDWVRLFADCFSTPRFLIGRN